MKKSYSLLHLALIFLFSYPVNFYAQSYYGLNFQGLHSISLNFTLDENPLLGLGYNYRNFNPGTGNAVVDWQVNLETSLNLKAYKLSAGMNYLNLDNDFQNSLGLGIGAHAFIQADPTQDAGSPYVGFDLSAYPGLFQNRFSVAPKIGFQYGVALKSEDAATEASDVPVLIPIDESGLLGTSNNFNRSHLYAGVVSDFSFNSTFPSKLSIGVDADLYRNVLLDTRDTEPEDSEEGLKVWPKIRLSTSF